MSGTMLGSVVGAVVAIVVALIGWMSTKAAQKASPYEAIAGRVVTLEADGVKQAKQIQDLIAEVGQLRRQLDAVSGERDAQQRQLEAERAARAAADAAHRTAVERLLTHIDVQATAYTDLAATLIEHAPDVSVPPLPPLQADGTW